MTDTPGESIKAALEPMPVPEGMVPGDYRMNPETEDVFYGYQLKEGMRVLMQRDLVDTNGPYWHANMTQALDMNRWCKVTQPILVGDTIVFIAVYDDGHKTVRQHGSYSGWLVKKDSIPNAEESTND